MSKLDVKTKMHTILKTKYNDKLRIKLKEKTDTLFFSPYLGFFVFSCKREVIFFNFHKTNCVLIYTYCDLDVIS